MLGSSDKVTNKEAMAEGFGFRVKKDATRLSLDLRDSLIALNSDQYLQSEFAAPINRSLFEAVGWFVVGVLLWIGLLIIQLK